MAFIDRLTGPKYRSAGQWSSSSQASAHFCAEPPIAIKRARNAVSFHYIHRNPVDRGGHSTATHAASAPDLRAQKSVWEDWSGRGSHVDYKKDEVVPLVQGRYLGWGANGGVHETTCKGVALAWKR